MDIFDKVSKMDIFDLEIEEFEKEIDKLLENISEEELFQELLQNGLIIDEYENNGYYIEEDFNNIWVHKIKTSNLKEIINQLFKRKIVNLSEAA